MIKEYQKKLGKDDILIIAGDFGLVWWNPERNLQEYKKDQKTLEMLRDAPFTTCFIDGNHENFDLLYTQPEEERWGGMVRVVDGCFHLQRGEVYTMEGYTLFTFGGATSVDKKTRRKGLSWWPQEVLSDQEAEKGKASLASHNWTVDYVITHTAPHQFRDVYAHTLWGKEMPCPTADYLTTIYPNITYQRWYFGHFHDDRFHEKLKAHLLFDHIVPLGGM